MNEREQTFDAEVVRHSLPRTLPGYITITLLSDTMTFEMNVIETDDSEEQLAVGRFVLVHALSDGAGSVAYSTTWRLHGAPRKQRLTLIRS